MIFLAEYIRQLEAAMVAADSQNELSAIGLIYSLLCVEFNGAIRINK
jgi:hypothetical protein